MEITESCVKKFNVAKAVIKPPLKDIDVMDIEILLISKNIPVYIKSYTTLDNRGNYNPRAYTESKLYPYTYAESKLYPYTESKLYPYVVISDIAGKKFKLEVSRVSMKLRELIEGV
jgi:hypothetical protein